MAHTDKMLKLLIELGKAGREVAQAANLLLAEATAPTGRAAENSADLAGANSQAADETRRAQEQLEAYNDGLAKLAVAAAGENLRQSAAAIAQVAQAFDAAAAAAGKFHAALSAAADGPDPIQTQIDRARQLTEVQLAGQKQLIEAYGRAELARLHSIGASPEQVSAAQSRNQSALEAIDRNERSEKGSAALLAEQHLRQQEHDRLSGDAATAAETAARTQFEQQQADLEAARAALASGTPTQPAGEDQLKRRVAGLAASEAARQQAVTEAHAQAERARQNDLRLKALPGEIAQAQAIEAQQAQNQSAVTAVTSAGRDIDIGIQAGKNLHTRQEYIEALQALAQSQADGRALALAAKAAAAAHGENLPIIAQMLIELRAANAFLASQISHAQNLHTSG